MFGMGKCVKNFQTITCMIRVDKFHIYSSSLQYLQEQYEEKKIKIYVNNFQTSDNISFLQ